MTISNLRFILASDVFVACIFPLAILVLGFRLFPQFTAKDLRNLVWPSSGTPSSKSYFSLERAYESYSQYARLSGQELSRMRASYAGLDRSNKRLGFNIGYPKKLDRLQQVIDLNATITESIAELTQKEFPSIQQDGPVDVGFSDLGRVRESLKHFVRDWSEEGLAERTRIFAPILDVLREMEPSQRSGMKVLVPGSGLGRLAWEISQLGFDTTANELSYFMTLAFRFLLSPQGTNSVNEHYLRPYAHWFSHQKSNDSLFRRIAFPDAVPRLSPTFHLVEQDFLTLKHPSASNAGGDGYDFIVTLFFIDTSTNVFATMKHIYWLLRPGGTWINLGPLLWPGNAEAKLELSLEEVLQAAGEVGFLVQTEGQLTSPRTVECEYTGDKAAMMRWIYKAEFWVATKSK